jgi:radical SAM superfamily enzyme YgiQ (UPF0313 family)
MTTAIFVDLFNSFFDPHGIYSIAAVLKKKGVSVKYVCESNHAKAAAALAALQPHYVLYSSFSATNDDYIRFDKVLKERVQAVSVIGGPGPTFEWKSFAASTIDAVCIGEGEAALPAFIEGGFSGSKNIVPSNATELPAEFFPLTDLNSLPFPDRSIVYDTDSLRSAKSVKHFLSGRGCPYDCTFCFNHAYRTLFKEYGPIIRHKSVDYFIEEIKQTKEKYGCTSVSFSDDTFVLNKKWLAEFCERFAREIAVPFTCGVRANLVDDDMVRVLRDSGCRAVNWSIEAGNPTIRNEILKRHMSDEQILNAASLFRKYKIPFWTGNVIGSPGETWEQMMETVQLNITAHPHFALAKIFSPYPGLELTQYAIEKGYYDPKNKTVKDDLFGESHLTMSREENVRLQKLMALFPFFVSYPFIFFTSVIRRPLFLLPRWLLRLLYEIFTTVQSMRLYVVRMPLSQRVKMAVRYLQNLKL